MDRSCPLCEGELIREDQSNAFFVCSGKPYTIKIANKLLELLGSPRVHETYLLSSKFLHAEDGNLESKAS